MSASLKFLGLETTLYSFFLYSWRTFSILSKPSLSENSSRVAKIFLFDQNVHSVPSEEAEESRLFQSIKAPLLHFAHLAIDLICLLGGLGAAVLPVYVPSDFFDVSVPQQRIAMRQAAAQLLAWRILEW
jgi:hypothetical protein